MSTTKENPLVIPRPNEPPCKPRPTISAPPESSFTSTFGHLLPAASFLTTPHGQIAYYSLPPLKPSSSTSSTPPTRVLLIHGIQTPALGLLPLARSLRAQFPHTHFTLFDLYGHGLSSTPYVPHVPALFHEAIDLLLDELSWPSAHLIGYSFGGVTAAGYAASRPEKVDSLALVAPAGLYRASDFGPDAEAHLRGDDEDAATDWVLNLLNGGPLVVPADWRDRVREGEVVAAAVKQWEVREHKGHVASVVAIFRDGGVMDSHETLRRAATTGVRRLVVLGESDDVGTEKDFADVGFEGAKTIEGVGHEVVRERASDVARLIGDFWRGTAEGV